MAFTVALSPMNAWVSFVTIGTATAAPTAAVPPPEMLPAMTSSLRLSSAATRTLPSAFTIELFPMLAFVVMLSTGTPAFTVTAAVPLNEAPTEIEVIFSLEVASTVVSPAVVIVSFAPIEAVVVLWMTSTSTPAPTPALPPTASTPAVERIVVVSDALTARVPPPVNDVSFAMLAVVVFVRTFTTTEPATPAVPPTEPPMAMPFMSSLCVALTDDVPAPAVSVSWSPMVALTLPLITKIAADTPTPADEPMPMLPAMSE